jgi:hypothetical protein
MDRSHRRHPRPIAASAADPTERGVCGESWPARQSPEGELQGFDANRARSDELESGAFERARASISGEASTPQILANMYSCPISSVG